MDYEQNQNREQTPGEQDAAAQQEAGQPAAEPQPSEWRDFRSVNHMPATPQKVRRVGTTTLGLTLVAVGVVLICSLFVPKFPLDMVLRFSPVVLILIGAEILYNAVVHREEKLRYDFLSMFVCFILIIASAGASGAVPAVRGMIAMDRAESRLGREIEDELYTALQGEEIADLYAGCYLSDSPLLYGSEVDANASWRELSEYISYGSINMTLSVNYDNPSDFAAKVREILEKIKPLELPFYDLYIRTKNDWFSIWLDNRWQWDSTAQELEEYVEYSEEYRSSLEPGYGSGDDGEYSYDD